MTTSDAPLFTVVITNYNYARFLGACVASVVMQGYPKLELVIVDDGSSDHSRSVIESLSAPVTAVFKANGGMISTWNAGFAASQGEYVMFLDADDFLLQGALAAHAAALREPEVVRSQGYLRVVDEGGAPTGARVPGRPSEDRALRELLLRAGPGAYVCPPTSANAWRRSLLERAFPLPEDRAIGADAFLFDIAPFFGETVTLDREVAVYRLHGGSMTQGKRPFTLSNIDGVLHGFDVREDWLVRFASAAGHVPDRRRWRERNWRLVTLRYLRSRLAGAAAPSFAAHVGAVLRARATLVKRAALVAVVLAIRALPTRASIRLASRVITLQHL